MREIPVTVLSKRFSDAVQYAVSLHTEARKQTSVPYMAHLLGVVSLVLGENGYLDFTVTEDIAIAALLHDAAEDKGGEPRLREIRERFGLEVERIVRGCSDSLAEDPNDKEEWHVRKQRYLDAIPHHDPATRLVAAADKLYNSRAMLDDYREIGEKLWPRFNRGREDQLWYLGSCIAAFRKAGSNRIVEELARTVQRLHDESQPHTSAAAAVTRGL